MMGARSRDEALDLAGAQSAAVGFLERSRNQTMQNPTDAYPDL